MEQIQTIKELTLNEINTIDIMAKEWFDKINGNSYFSANVTLNFSKENQKVIKLNFQYGYGEQYEYESLMEIIRFLNIDYKETSIYRFCRENNIILRSNKEQNCLKRDL